MFFFIMLPGFTSVAEFKTSYNKYNENLERKKDNYKTFQIKPKPSNTVKPVLEVVLLFSYSIFICWKCFYIQIFIFSCFGIH
jgi:hypothetical protein